MLGCSIYNNILKTLLSRYRRVHWPASSARQRAFGRHRVRIQLKNIGEIPEDKSTAIFVKFCRLQRD